MRQTWAKALDYVSISGKSRNEAMRYTRGGGVTSIYTGTGRVIFGVPFFEQEINFGVSFLVRL